MANTVTTCEASPSVIENSVARRGSIASVTRSEAPLASAASESATMASQGTATLPVSGEVRVDEGIANCEAGRDALLAGAMASFPPSNANDGIAGRASLGQQAAPASPQETT